MSPTESSPGAPPDPAPAAPPDPAPAAPPAERPAAGERVVAEPGWERLLIWTLFPLLGAGAIAGLHALTDWLVKLPWAPVKIAAKFVKDLPDPAATLGAIGIGVVAGLIVAVTAVHEQLAVTVAADRVTLARRDGTVREVDGKTVDLVFLDGKHLVLLDAAGAELAREKSDLKGELLREAFEAHGYRWVDEDPHLAEYRLWVAPVGDLPESVNVLLTARQKALKDGKTGYAARIRTELSHLGFIIRDDKKHQHWRHPTPPTP
ncbi:YqeB family protein [Micromonospora sp. NPDC004704]